VYSSGPCAAGKRWLIVVVVPQGCSSRNS